MCVLCVPLHFDRPSWRSVSVAQALAEADEHSPPSARSLTTATLRSLRRRATVAAPQLMYSRVTALRAQQARCVDKSFL